MILEQETKDDRYIDRDDPPTILRRNHFTLKVSLNMYV